MSDIQIVQHVTLNIDKNETIEVHRKLKEDKPGFAMIGTGQRTRNNLDSVDLLLEISQMSSNEKLCFFMIRDSYVFDRHTNRINYQPYVKLDDLTASQKSKFSNGYSSLFRKNLVRRVKKGTYMINPNAIVPKHYLEELNVWNSLKGNNDE